MRVAQEELRETCARGARGTTVWRALCEDNGALRVACAVGVVVRCEGGWGDWGVVEEAQVDWGWVGGQGGERREEG